MSPIEIGKQPSILPTDTPRPEDYFKEAENMLHPPIHRAAYSDRMAWILASMAQLAYDRFEDHNKENRTDKAVVVYKDFLTKLRYGGFEWVETFNSDATDTQAFLTKNKDFAVLAFRGTEPTRMQDILTDLKASKKFEAHGGFTYAFDSIAVDIVKHLEKLHGLPLYITGHSLGAALATVATYSLEHNYPELGATIAACYTFGSPRVGSRKYDFRAPIYRVVNTTDIVTTVPLLAMGYVPLGDVRYLGMKDGEFQRGIPALHRLFLFLLAVFKLFGPLVRDHGIDHYRRKLRVIAEERAKEIAVLEHHRNIVK